MNQPPKYEDQSGFRPGMKHQRSFSSQVLALLQKNWRMQTRKKSSIAFQWLGPLLIAGFIYYRWDNEKIKNTIEYETSPLKNISVSNDFDVSSLLTSDNHIFYTPNTPATTNVANKMKDMVMNTLQSIHGANFREAITPVHFTPVETEEEGVQALQRNSTYSYLVVFSDVKEDSTTLPHNMRCTIRPPPKTKWHTNMEHWIVLEEPKYRKRGVLLLQRLITDALIATWKKGDGATVKEQEQIEIQLQKLPFPVNPRKEFLEFMEIWLRISLLLSFVIQCMAITESLVLEKEIKIKEAMNVMGLEDSAYISSWILTCLAITSPPAILFTLLLVLDISSNGPIFLFSDWSVILLFFAAYITSLSTACYMMSTFVNKVKYAGGVASIIYIVTFFGAPLFESLGRPAILASSLLLNAALYRGASILVEHERVERDADLTTFHEPPTGDVKISLLEIVLSLLLSAFLHIVVAWIVQSIWAGDVGVSRTRQLFLQFRARRQQSTGLKSPRRSSAEVAPEANIDEDPKYFEREPSNVDIGIQIRKLKKKFGSKVAVAGISLNMYKGQITALLGHNGAGKTTTMSMLTGFYAPTSGTAIIDGQDICADRQKARESVGFCPQHDILYGLLTVAEHLELFAKLKGVPDTILSSEVSKMVALVGLEAKTKAQSRSLSGGMKRALSVGIALIGDSKIVILDEPTSGMDPGARRRLWDVLAGARDNRTILLTTHYMDEADYLGDRIAIMGEGAIVCCGSPFFLKSLYGVGYRLAIVKSEKCDVTKLTTFIKSHVATAELESNDPREVVYILPTDDSSGLPKLFKELEDDKDKLGLTAYGASATTMEEVFLKVGETAGVKDEDDVSNPSEIMESGGVRDVTAFKKGYKNKTGLALLLSQMRGQLTKRAVMSLRTIIFTMVLLLTPLVMELLIFALLKLLDSKLSTDEKALVFDLEPFENSYIPYSTVNVLNNGKMDHNPDTFGKVYSDQFGSSLKLENFMSTIEEGAPKVNLTSFIEEIGAQKFREKAIIGMASAAFAKDKSRNVLVLYNKLFVHSQPISMSYALNAMVQYVAGPSYSLQFTFHPAPSTEEMDEEDSASSLSTMVYMTVFGIIVLLRANFLVLERQVGSKHLQVVSGISTFGYWVPTFIFDFIGILIATAAYTCVRCITQSDLDMSYEIAYLLAILAYAWSALPAVYALQFLISHEDKLSILMWIFFGVGFLPPIVNWVLGLLDFDDLEDIIEDVSRVVICNFNLQLALQSLEKNKKRIEFCEPIQDQCNDPSTNTHTCCKDTCVPPCLEYDDTYFGMSEPGIGEHLLIFLGQGIVTFILVFFIDSNASRLIWYKIKEQAGKEVTENMKFEEEVKTRTEDSDVLAERKRLQSSPNAITKNESLVLMNLYKYYGSHLAVNHSFVGVAKEECFGLLGQNGAGKTTTFKMLTGDIQVSGGNAYLMGHSVKQDLTKVQSLLGYCPQFDALLVQMTGRETLVMFARIRGVPENVIPRVVNALMDLAGMARYADVRCGFYSGGNKRKLSVAIALIGDPPFIFLDEPSAGMDPVARRKMWTLLSEVRASGNTLILTSHSMEECDALCTRIVIMVNGRFLCLGSPQHLKTKFSQGFTLVAELGTEEGSDEPPPNGPLIDYVKRVLPGAEVFEEHRGYVRFTIENANIPLSHVFSRMEEAKVSLNVTTYRVNQTSLEQVFLALTQQQN